MSFNNKNNRSGIEDQLHAAFDRLDKDNDGKVTANDLLRAYAIIAPDNNSFSRDEKVLHKFIESKLGHGSFTLPQFHELLDSLGLHLSADSLPSDYSLEANLAGLLRDIALADFEENEIEEPNSTLAQKSSILTAGYWTNEFDWTIFKNLLAGGIAGGVSRTVVSPLERMKILFQVQGPNKGGYDGVFSTLAKIWREEGFLGYMRGNGTNVIRIVPYSAVQFAAYERYKNLLVVPGTNELNTPRRLTAGALAGITSVVCTYPLDIVRTRLSVQSASMGMGTSKATKSSLTSNVSPVLASAGVRNHTTKAMEIPKLPGIWETLKHMYLKEGGIRALYQGLGPTLMGVAPYVALNFQSYEVLRAYFTPPGETSPSGVHKLVCGACAGTIAQTFTYPLDVLRRRMQVTGMSDLLGYKYDSTWHATKEIVKKEGIRGLYKGMIPNYLKVAPAIGVSFYTYELCKTYLD